MNPTVRRLLTRGTALLNKHQQRPIDAARMALRGCTDRGALRELAEVGLAEMISKRLHPTSSAACTVRNATMADRDLESGLSLATVGFKLIEVASAYRDSVLASVILDGGKGRQMMPIAAFGRDEIAWHRARCAEQLESWHARAAFFDDVAAALKHAPVDRIDRLPAASFRALDSVAAKIWSRKNVGAPDTERQAEVA